VQRGLEPFLEGLGTRKRALRVLAEVHGNENLLTIMRLLSGTTPAPEAQPAEWHHIHRKRSTETLVAFFRHYLPEDLSTRSRTTVRYLSGSPAKNIPGPLTYSSS
jgi:hypothetical protein